MIPVFITMLWSCGGILFSMFLFLSLIYDFEGYKKDFLLITTKIVVILFLTFPVFSLIWLPVNETVYKTYHIEIKYNDKTKIHEMWRKTENGYEIKSFEKELGKTYSGQEVKCVYYYIIHGIFKFDTRMRYEIIENSSEEWL